MAEKLTMDKHAVRCAGCSHQFEDGDGYIVDTASGFTKNQPNAEVDGLIADIFGGTGTLILLCECCTEPGGDYPVHTFNAESA